MEKYGKRVALARSHVGLSQTKLAQALSITQPWLSELEAGDATSSKHTLKIARITGVRPEWLDSGEEPMLAPDATAPSRTSVGEEPRTFRPENEDASPALVLSVPVMNASQERTWDHGEDEGIAICDRPSDHVPRPIRLFNVGDAYALYALSDSMFPWREHGQLVFVHPSLPIRPGDYVVVQLKTKPGGKSLALIRRLVKRDAKAITVRQYNPAKNATIPTKDIAAVHRVVDWPDLLGLGR